MGFLRVGSILLVNTGRWMSGQCSDVRRSVSAVIRADDFRVVSQLPDTARWLSGLAKVCGRQLGPTSPQD